MRLMRSRDAHAGTASDRPHRLPRGVRIGFMVLAGLSAVFVVAIAVVVGVILTGPTELGFVRDRYQTTLQEQLGAGYTVTVDTAVIDVDPVLGLVLEIDGTAITDADGASVADIPSTRLAIEPLALLSLNLSVSTVEFNGAALSLVRSTEGEVLLGNAATRVEAGASKEASATPRAPAGPDGGFPQIAAALQLIDSGLELPLNTAIEAEFRSLSFVGGTIEVWDAVQRQQRRFTDTDFSLTIDPQTRSLNASIATSGFAGRWSGTFDRTVDAETGERMISGVFSQLTLADIFPDLGSGEEGLASADIPLYGRASFGFAADGTVQSASMRLDVGAGIISADGKHRDIILDEATLKLRWDIADRVIVVEPSPIFFGETRGIATGWVRPTGQPGDQRYGFSLQSRGAVLAASDANAPAILADRIVLSGVVDMAEQLLDIQDFAIQTRQGSLTLAGTVGFEGDAPSLALAASLSPMTVATFKQMWIPFVAPGARRWVMANMTGGRIESGQFEAAVPPGVLTGAHPAMPDNGLNLNLRLEDVGFKVFGDLPPITGASGNLVLAGATFGVDVEGAEVKVASGETVTIDAGAFAIDDVFDPAAIGIAEVHMTGAAAAFGAIVDARPLEVLSQRSLSPDDLSGSAGVAVSVRLPLEKDEDELGDAMDWKVTVEGQGLASRAPIEGRMFDKADITLVVTKDSFAVDGTADIDGVPAGVSFSQALDAEGQSVGRGQQLARLSLDEAARKKLGLALDDIIDGTIHTQISGLADGDGQHYDLDLEPARLTLPGLGWTKGIGVPATLSFDLIPIDNGYVAENVVFAGEGFGFDGAARIDHDEGLVSADIDHFVLRPGDSARFTLTANKGGYTIKASGAAFDVRGVISELTGESTGGATPDLTVEAAFDRATGFNGGTVENAKVRFATVKGYVSALSLGGSLGGNRIAATYTETRNGAKLAASAPNVGDVLRYVDFYTKLGGGSLSVDAERVGTTGPLVGKLVVTDFDILNEPAVERAIANAPTRKGIDTARLHFDRMVGQFDLSSEAIKIKEALLRGQAVGATFSGRVDLINALVAINGTYLPVYALNNVFGRVPVLGLVLGGGNREGLIGVTFRVEGALDDPQVFFNPLSAVAPGIFRKIFEFR